MKRSPLRRPQRPGERKRYSSLKRTAFRRRPPRRLSRAGADPAFLAFVREMPCSAMLLAEPGRDGLPGPHRCRGRIEANHDTQNRGVGQKAPDRRAFPLCSKAHRDWHALRGPFAGWSKAERRAWEDGCVEAMQRAATPGADRRDDALALQSLDLGRVVDEGGGRWSWIPGPTRPSEVIELPEEAYYPPGEAPSTRGKGGAA